MAETSQVITLSLCFVFWAPLRAQLQPPLQLRGHLRGFVLAYDAISGPGLNRPGSFGFCLFLENSRHIQKSGLLTRPQGEGSCWDWPSGHLIQGPRQESEVSLDHLGSFRSPDDGSHRRAQVKPAKELHRWTQPRRQSQEQTSGLLICLQCPETTRFSDDLLQQQ